MRMKIAVLLIVIPLVSVFAQTENVQPQPQPTQIQTPAQTERPQTAASADSCRRDACRRPQPQGGAAGGCVGAFPSGKLHSCCRSVFGRAAVVNPDPNAAPGFLRGSVLESFAG